MPTQLPIVTMNGKQYYLDVRLQQLRSAVMDGPIDFIEIDDLDEGDYLQIRDEYLKAMGLN